MSKNQQKITVHPDYILVERSREYKVVLSREPESMAEIMAVCAVANCQKLLIMGPDTRVRLSVMDVFDLGKDIASMGLRVAVVEAHDASNEDVEFLETVSQNRGGPIRFFDARKDAEDWLRMG